LGRSLDNRGHRLYDCGRYYISSCNREIEQTLRAMEEEEKRP
jgi:hypothetical protein